MQVIGKTMIFKKEYEGKNLYSTNISNKDINGNYTNMYVSVQLPKGVEVENKTYIEITKGFLAFYKDKNGMPKIKIVAMEIKQDEPKQEENYFTSESDLPF